MIGLNRVGADLTHLPPQNTSFGRTGQAATARTEAPDSVQPDSPEASREVVEAAVDRLQEFFAPLSRDLKFSIHEGSGRIVVKVIDSATSNVVRQFPSEEVLRLAEFIGEMQSSGLLINGTA